MKTIYIIALAAGVLALAGCQNDEVVNRQDVDGMTVRYAVASDSPVQGRAEMGNAGTMLSLRGNGDSLSIPMEWTVTDGIGIGPAPDGTKGTLVNTTGNDDKALSEFASLIGNTFVAEAFDGNRVKKVSQTVTWSTTNSAWEATPEVKWPKGTSLNFLAYANLPGSQTATITEDGVSTVHTVPASAADQKDILFGHYSGNGDNTGTAKIRFEHPLTAVRFLQGELGDGFVIKSISLEGIAETGTASMAPDGTITWSGVESHEHTVSQITTDGLSVDATTSVIGEPFLIIPQNLAENNVTVKVTFTDGTEVMAVISDGQWRAGYTNTYVLSQKKTLEIEIDDIVNGNVKENVEIKSTANSTVKCYIRALIIGNWHQNLGTTSEPVPGAIMAPWALSDGTFEPALAATAGTAVSNWVLGADGFYYYKYPVYPNTETGTGADGTGTADKLFSTYTAPEDAPVAGTYLNLSIVAQAVKWDADKAAVMQAWGATAAGYLSATDKESNSVSE